MSDPITPAFAPGLSCAYDRDPALARLVEDDALDVDGAVQELLASARRGRPSLSDDEALDVLEHVVAEARARRRRARGATGALWFTSLAAALAVIGTLTGPGVEHHAAMPGVVVKHISFESVHEGKVTRFEITVYRTDEKEEADVPNPPL